MPEQPGAERRRPRRSSTTWTVREPLARWLRGQGEAARGLDVLDVGCGVKPYAPFFAAASSYVGVDTGGNPHADLEGTIDALPVEDGSYDLVLCIQVLEHVPDPAGAVRELRRAVRPGGRVLASTHGVSVYHPHPEDLWRWTHTGLERLFRDNGEWAEVTVIPGSGTTACVAMLLGYYVDLLAQQAGLAVLARPVVAALNLLGRRLDRAVPRLRQPIPGSLFANYHVVAVAAP